MGLFTKDMHYTITFDYQGKQRKSSGYMEVGRLVSCMELECALKNQVRRKYPGASNIEVTLNSV